jgi:DNA-binding response OmpR family regulator
VTTEILLVEDEPSIALLMSRVLAAAGYGVTHAATGAAALQAARTVDHDLIVLDLILPDMRGERVLAEVMVIWPGSRVLVVSSVTDAATRAAVLRQGALDFLAKPFANAELLARVRAWIRDDRREPGPPMPPIRCVRGNGRLGIVEQGEVVADGRAISW